MTHKNQKTQAALPHTALTQVALVIYSLLGVIGIGTCFIVDFIHNEGVTWSLYVLYSVPVLFLGMLPLCFHFKHNKILSLAVLSLLTIPFLYLLDTIIPTSDWFAPLALPVAWKFIAGLWVCGVIFRLIKVNKWYLSSILTGAFGAFISVSTISSVNQYRGKELSPLYTVIALFSIGVIAAGLVLTGYLRRLNNKMEEKMADILIADDDIQIASLIEDSLTDEGFTVVAVHDGQAVLDKLEAESFRLILLDIMMPKMDGLEVCRKIRDKTNCPIIFVSAKSRTLDTLVGLEIGGDDYIKKPFIVEELVAKVKAHIRRDKRTHADQTSSGFHALGDLRIYADNYEVFKGADRIELSTREFQLLLFLWENKGRVLTREQIFDEVWGLDYSDIGTVTVTIKNLRDKLDPDNQMIKTVWGVGYKLIQPVAEIPHEGKGK